MRKPREIARVLVLTAAVGVLSTACGFSGAGSVQSASCGNMAGGACSEQIDRMQQRHPGAVSVDLECAVPVCDRRSGQGTAVITMPDGSRLNDAFAYVGDPAAIPAPACLAVPLDQCRNLANEEAENMPPSQRIVAIQVSCTAPAGCTPARGAASVSVTLGNGTTQGTETSWEGGP